MKKSYNLATMTVMTALLLGATSVAFAEGASTTTIVTGSTTTPVVTPLPMPVPPVMQPGEMKLQVGAKGQALIRGNVESVGADYVMVKSWGGTWKVKVTAASEILPNVNGGLADLTKYAVGDYVGAQGTVSTSEAWTINATVIRNRTEHKAIVTERKQNEKEMRETMQEDRKAAHDAEARNYEGTVGTVTGLSMTIMNGSTSIAVTTTATTKFVNRNWANITFADVKPGDTLRVYGPSSSSTVMAQVVRDLSVPR